MMSQRSQLPVLTGLRFIAAFSVLLAHSLHSIFRQEATSPFLHQFALQLAYIGLTLFFVLSGCVLTLNYGQDFKRRPLGTLRKFWVARIARLYPLYIFFSFIFLAFVPNAIFTLKKIFPWNFLLVQTWTFSWEESAPRALYFFPYAWSISSEMFLYLFMPIISLVLFISKKIKLDLLLFAALYAATIFILFKAYHSVVLKGHTTWLGLSVISPIQFLQLLAYYTPFSHISSFFAGCVVGKCILNQNKLISNKLGAILPWVLLGIYFFFLIDVIPPDSQHNMTAWDLPKHGMIYAPFVALFVFILAKYQNSLSRLLSTHFCQRFGETSYSIYLLHPLIAGLFSIHLIDERLTDPGQWIRLFIIVSFTLIISTSTYSLIEVPGRRWLRNKLSGMSSSKIIHWNSHNIETKLELDKLGNLSIIEDKIMR